MLGELSCNGFAKIGAAGTRSEYMKNVGSNLVAAAISLGCRREGSDRGNA